MSSGAIYVAVEGPIGVGKTTLVNGLRKRMNARLVLEIVEENPFLSSFYSDKTRYAFQTQLFFLMSRFKQQEDLHQADLFRPNVVADYHLLKDRIFAQLTLQDHELALYERVYTSLEKTIVQPDVVVYLNARQDVLMQRIARRDRPFERDFDPAYLRELSQAYTRFFAHYDRTPLLALDTTEIDYVADPTEIDRIYGQVLELAGD